MKYLSILLIVFYTTILSTEAQLKIDSLNDVWLDKTQVDSTRFKAINSLLLNEYLYSKPDTAYKLAQQFLDLAQKKGNKSWEAQALFILGYSSMQMGELTRAIEYFERSLKIREKNDDNKEISNCLYNIGSVYYTQGKYNQALEYRQRSLKISENIGYKNGVARALNGVGLIYWDQGNYTDAQVYIERSLVISEEIGDKDRLASSINNIGLIYKDQGKYKEALEYFERSMQLFKEIGNQSFMSNSLENIGIINAMQGKLKEGLSYFEQSLIIREKLGNKLDIAECLNSIGVVYVNLGKIPAAIEYLERALKLKIESGDKQSIAISLNNIGSVYHREGNIEKALEYYERSLKIKEEIGHKDGIAASLNDIGLAYKNQGKNNEAIKYLERALSIGQEIGSPELIRDASELLYQLNAEQGDGMKALEMHKLFVIMRDSINSKVTAKKLQKMQFDRKMLADSIANAETARKVQEAHKEEIRQKNNTRNWSMASAAFALLLAGGFYFRWRFVNKAKNLIEKEKERSETLLLNILPAEIAEELKENGKADARDFDLVSIIFTDFKSFTQASEKLTAAELVKEINICFQAFDGIMGKYDIEKIKTIGDAYMAAGGIPVPAEDSVKNTVLACLEMQAFMTNRSIELDSKDLPNFKMRAGIHTGPVVAGIVGVKKFQYDIWGDTVNTASRMESAGEVGKVNISQTTYNLLKDDADFVFKSRGLINAKGKGEMEMIFVELKIQD